MTRFVIALVLLLVIGLPGCASAPARPDSPAAIVGSDFQAAASEALQAYADYKAGNHDITWALQKMFNAYSLYAKTSPDVKALIKAWAGNSGDSQALADKLARIFGASTSPPEVKMAALAQITQSVAQNKGP